MTISIKQDNLTVAVELEEDGFEKYRGVSDIKGWLMHKDA